MNIDIILNSWRLQIITDDQNTDESDTHAANSAVDGLNMYQDEA